MVRRGLARLTGAVIESAEVRHPRSVRRHGAGPADFEDRLRGRRLLGAHRRGKYLWLALDNDDALLGHLGMTGQLLVQPHGVEHQPHLRVLLALSAGRDLRFVDQRTFGHLLVSDAGAGLPTEIAHIGRDPLDPCFDVQELTDRLRHRRTGVKRALLDQSLVSGVGNIYADEALWAARLHYARPTETLRRAEVERLVGAVTEVMTRALAEGGTTFDSMYVNVDGQSGYFERSLAVYGRDEQPCLRCGTAIRRTPFMNRSSYTCPRCQPRPRRARW